MPFSRHVVSHAHRSTHQHDDVVVLKDRVSKVSSGQKEPLPDSGGIEQASLPSSCLIPSIRTRTASRCRASSVGNRHGAAGRRGPRLAAPVALPCPRLRLGSSGRVGFGPLPHMTPAAEFPIGFEGTCAIDLLSKRRTSVESPDTSSGSREPAPCLGRDGSSGPASRSLHDVRNLRNVPQRSTSLKMTRT